MGNPPPLRCGEEDSLPSDTSRSAYSSFADMLSEQYANKYGE